MNIQEIIGRKRDGGTNATAELRALANGAADGSIPDDQIAAWLMAAYIRGLNPRETADLTLAMAASGERLDRTGLPKPWIDKHSTGGVGDKTTIVLMPLLAACGVPTVKMSGRGLGVTGGTVDKLEAVPGFRTDLSPSDLLAQARRVGVAWTGQTPLLAPADKRMYALRDSIGAVESLPLIVSSILSKKIASGADAIVMDVKCGSGAFVRDLAGARTLAASLIETSRLAQIACRAVITDMSQPLGTTVGNALEVKEAIRILKGEQGRVTDLCLELASIALHLAGKPDPSEMAARALSSGAALGKAVEWFAAQGGDISVFSSDSWQVAPVRLDVTARTDGWIKRVDARTVGEVAVALGAGRRSATDVVDPSVGIEVSVEVGDCVSRADRLFIVHAASDGDARLAADRLQSAVEITQEQTHKQPVVIETLS